MRDLVNLRIAPLTDSIAFVVHTASRIAGGKSNIATTPGHLSRRCLLAVGYLPSYF